MGGMLEFKHQIVLKCPNKSGALLACIFPETAMIRSALTSHQGWVVGVQWSPNKEHQLLSGSYDSSLKSVYSCVCIGL